jgi:transcriptional regulator with XRE-family HTH domain
MAASVQALVNPPLLVWAREQNGYARESVANRLKVKLERLLAWEQGDLKPTVRQLQQLAFRRTAGTSCGLRTRRLDCPLITAGDRCRTRGSY